MSVAAKEINEIAAEAAIAELRTVLEGDDKDAIEAKAQALTQAAMKIGEAVYKAQQEAAGEAAAEADAQDEENIVDADFEEVPEDDADDQKAS